MLTRKELQKIARARLKDAQILFQNRRYEGAAYLCGYAIELWLKARICRTLGWEGFPSTNREFHKRWQREFDKLIYIDILGMENIPYDWELVEETTEDEIKKLQNKIKVGSNEDNDKEYKWQIGRLGEAFVYEKLKEKFGAENVIWHNKDSNSINEDKGGIDIEIIKRGRTTHKIEVKSTIDSISLLFIGLSTFCQVLTIRLFSIQLAILRLGRKESFMSVLPGNAEVLLPQSL